MSDIAKVLRDGLREFAARYREMLRRVGTGATGVKCANSFHTPTPGGDMAGKKKDTKKATTRKTTKKTTAPKTARAKRGTRKATAKKAAE